VRAVREIVPGAPPPTGVIPLAVPDIGDAERAAVDEVLRSGWIAYGSHVDEFERQAAQRVGRRHAIGVASGTAALHVALLLAGVRPDDEVVVSTLTFASPAFAIAYVQAHPVLMDAERETWQIDPAKLAQFLRDECVLGEGGLRNRSSGRRIGALLPVSILGHPADLDAVGELAAQYELPVVEDAAEGLGARCRDRPVGGFGDISCLSFNANKIVTSAGGGMILTDDDAWAERARYLIAQAKNDPLEYVHGEIGFNYRLSNVHAAIGVVQLSRLDEIVLTKRRIAERYREGFAGVAGIDVPPEAPWAFSTFWLYTIQVVPEEYGMESRELMHRLLEADIQVRPLWQPLHRSPALRHAQAYGGEAADELHRRGLSLPCSISLTDEEQDRVIDEIARAPDAQRRRPTTIST